LPKINEGGNKSNRKEKNFNNKVLQEKNKEPTIQVTDQIGETEHGKSKSRKQYQKNRKNQFKIK
jgi:hypothetical protein